MGAIEKADIERLCDMLYSIDVVQFPEYDISCFQLVSGASFEDSIVTKSPIVQSMDIFSVDVVPAEIVTQPPVEVMLTAATSAIVDVTTKSTTVAEQSIRSTPLPESATTKKAGSPFSGDVLDKILIGNCYGRGVLFRDENWVCCGS